MDSHLPMTIALIDWISCLISFTPPSSSCITWVVSYLLNCYTPCELSNVSVVTFTWSSSCCFWRVSCCLSSLTWIILSAYWFSTLICVSQCKKILRSNRKEENQRFCTCLEALPRHPAMQINLPTPAGQSLRVPMWVPYFLQSWSQLLQGRLLSRNLWVLQPRREPTLGKVCGLFSPPSTAWSPRRWPRPAGSLGWWPPRWGRSYWQGCQDKSGTFSLACKQSALRESPEK